MGIQKRVGKSGVSYLVSWKDSQGRRRTQTVRGSLAEARELEIRKKNLLLKSTGREQQKIPLFGAYAADLLEGSDHGLRAITADGYLKNLRSYSKSLMGQPLDRIDVREFERLVAKKSASTAKYSRAIVRAVLSRARVEYQTDFPDPWKFVRVKSRQQTRREVGLSIADTRRLMSAGPLWVRTAVSASLRISELRGLRVDDLIDDTLTVRRSVRGRHSRSVFFYTDEPKSASGRRTIQIPSALADELRGQAGVKGPLLDVGSDQGLGMSFARCVSRLGFRESCRRRCDTSAHRCSHVQGRSQSSRSRSVSDMLT